MDPNPAGLTLHGIVQSAELVEVDPAAGRLELVIRAQGVGPTAPRKLIVPFELLLADETLDPDAIQGKGFEASVVRDANGRWVVAAIALAGRMLKANDSP